MFKILTEILKLLFNKVFINDISLILWFVLNCALLI